MAKNNSSRFQSGALIRLQQAKAFVLANPEMSKRQQVAATGLSETTVARARRELVAEGRLALPRNALAVPPYMPQPLDPDAIASEQPREDPPILSVRKSDAQKRKLPPTMLDHEAMIKLAEMVEVAVESGDDELIQKTLIKQCIRFALDPSLHPDTRLSASTMWGKLRDMGKSKDIGPGKPKTYEAAVLRLVDMLLACGPEMTIDAVNRAFTVKEPLDGEHVRDESTTETVAANSIPEKSGERNSESVSLETSESRESEEIHSESETDVRVRSDAGESMLPPTSTAGEVRNLPETPWG